MNKLIIIVGDSGSGKTHLLRLIANNYSNNCSIMKKYSNRELRKGEENAIEIKAGCSEEELQEFEYSYVGKNNKLYCFSKTGIDKTLQEGKSPVIIIGDDTMQMVLRLLNDYEDRVCPIYIQRDTFDNDFIRELTRTR